MKPYLILAALCLTSAAVAQPTGVQIIETPLGPTYADANGMTLYTFANDAPSQSTCTDKCLNKWPAAEVAEGATAQENFTILTREDGTRQWMLNNQPLYTWVMDLSPGQTTGHGVGGVWQAAQPESPAETPAE